LSAAQPQSARRRPRSSILRCGAALLALLWTLPACDPLRLAAQPRPAEDLDSRRIASDVAWLADPTREGRGLTTAGLEEAAQYLAQGFQAAGLAPGAPDGSYFQRFDAPAAIRVAHAALEQAGAPRRFSRGRHFEALLTSGDGDVTAPVVFAGYGISAPQLGYDDYAGIDVTGRAVLILDHRPAGDMSPLAGEKGLRFLTRSHKLEAARRHGAVAVLLAPSARHLKGLPGGGSAEQALPTLPSHEIVSLAVTRAVAGRLVAQDGEETLEDRQAQIDTHGAPRSELLRGVRVRASVRIERRFARVANVLGVLRGADPARAHEAVVIGAHYDALGLGEFGSLAPDQRGSVHPGADDNASGAAGLLALARAFAAAPRAPRSLVLAAFTGEEAGLLGSAEYVREPSFPLHDTLAMINLDMIGRLRERRATVFGAESSLGFRRLVARAAREHDLEAVFSQEAFGPSDHTTFLTSGIPALFFFTGMHAQYHRPSDVPQLVNAAGMADLLAVVARVAEQLLHAPSRPAFVAAPAPPGGGARAGGYGPYLGTVPELGSVNARGVRLLGVRAGSPAELAGLRAGDVIVELDGSPIASLEELAVLLAGAQPGQRVSIVVERAAQRVELTATLGQRR
jgi:hypothetical protein